jgi:hypothetical protein
MKMSDAQLFAVLAGFLDGVGTAEIVAKNPSSDKFTVELELEVHDNHRRDSPDVILQIALTIAHPRLPKLKLKIPIPIEGEKAGIGAALEDLKKFAERKNFPQKLPMLVVGGAGNPARRSHEIAIPVKFEIVQVPYRSLSE